MTKPSEAAPGRAPGPDPAAGPAPAETGAAIEGRQFAQRAGKAGSGTLISRVFGLLRDQIMAAMLGAGYASDAFNSAFRVPNMLRDLVAEGSLSVSFVPTFTEYDQKRSPEEAWALGRQLMMTLLTLVAGLCVLAWIFTPQVVHWVAAGFESVPGKIELTEKLFRIMLPFTIFVALAAVAIGMLNARNVFFVPAAAPALLNIGMIVFGLGLIPVLRHYGQPPVVAMAVGVVIGSVLQFAVQLPSLHRQGFRFRFEWPTWHPGVARVALLMVPATIGLAGTNVNVMVANNIASHLVQGSVTWLYCAFRLMQLPIGLFGSAVGSVALPTISRSVVDGDIPGVRQGLVKAVSLVLVLTIPSAVMLAVFAEPTVALLFEHGRFHADATAQTAGALVMYCIGLPSFASILIFSRTFYALRDSWKPMQSTLVSVTINVVLNLLLIGPWRGLGMAHRGLALAGSVAAMVNVTQLAFYLRSKIGPFGARRILDTALRALLVAAPVGLLLWLGMHALGTRWHHGHLKVLATVLVGGTLGCALMWGGLRLVRVPEVADLEGMVTASVARLVRRRGRAA